MSARETADLWYASRATGVVAPVLLILVLACGIPITEVSRWLGHKSIEVTHQIYGHLVPASWDRARTVLDDARRVGRRHPPRPGTPALNPFAQVRTRHVGDGAGDAGNRHPS